MSSDGKEVKSNLSNGSIQSGRSKSSSKKTPTTSPRCSIASVQSKVLKHYDDDSQTPDFIYGGPFIRVDTPRPFFNTATPINLQLQGSFKKSFAYYSLKERLPIILTKVIDYCSREGIKIKASCGAKDEDLQRFIKYVAQLKNDLVTNKKYAYLTVKTAEADRWNKWIDECENTHYFTNTWVFTECYVYRRLREGCELCGGLKDFDPFDAQKDKSFHTSVGVMCQVADRVIKMLPESERDKRKADFITLLKICLWANKCDLSLTLGEQVTNKASAPSSAPVPPSTAPSPSPSTVSAKGKAAEASATEELDIDPFQMIIDFKDKVLVDDSTKIADGVPAKAEALVKAIEAAVSVPPSGKGSPKGSAPPSPPPGSAPLVGTAPPGEEGEEGPKIPCPAKMTVPQALFFDIVCDNAGYELFTDLCLAHFLIAQKIVQKIRFHVKSIPWFVSDVTRRDFKYVIDSCRASNYRKEVPMPPKEAVEGGEPEPQAPRVISADNLRVLGDQWTKYFEDGTFIVMSDDFWTSPHVYKDMKKYDYNLYRKLQFAVAVLFKGDLNYRKLLGEKNWNPVTSFETSLQGFMPAPLIALRTVKADLISGLPKGKWEQLNTIDEKWMEKGDYGVIQFCPKAEPFKPADKPCMDYGDTCFSTVCPIHTEL